MIYEGFLEITFFHTFCTVWTWTVYTKCTIILQLDFECITYILFLFISSFAPIPLNLVGKANVQHLGLQLKHIMYVTMFLQFLTQLMCLAKLHEGSDTEKKFLDHLSH